MAVFGKNEIQGLIDRGYEVDVGAYYREAWALVKAGGWHLLAVLIAVFLLQLPFERLPRLWSALSICVGVPAGYVTALLLLCVAEGLRPGEWVRRFRWSVLLSYFLVSVLWSMLTVLGVFLFILPGIYFLLAFSFADTLVAAGITQIPSEALRLSWRIVKRSPGRILALFLPLHGVSILLSLVGKASENSATSIPFQYLFLQLAGTASSVVLAALSIASLVSMTKQVSHHPMT